MNILRMTILGFVSAGLLSLPAMAQITTPLTSDIPFPFTVGDTQLPAGTYTIRVVDDSDLNSLLIASMDGKTSVRFLARETDLSQPATRSELEFQKYGDREFLSAIFEEGTMIGSAPNKGHVELKLIKSHKVKRVVHRHPTRKK